MNIDQYGNDPLYDEFWGLMYPSNIKHVVTQGEEGNPQSVAYTYYNNVNYYKFILAYNALRHPSEFIAGITVIIPTIVPKTNSTLTISI